MIRVMMHNLQGSAVSELSAESMISYRQLEDGLKILQSWIQHTLKLARPQMIGVPAARRLEIQKPLGP